jgi:hypothetical protein
MRRSLINDIEEYHTDSANLINAVCKILNIEPQYLDMIRKNKTTTLDILAYIIDIFYHNQPQTPIKELYDFYVFCNTYMFDESSCKLPYKLKQKLIKNQKYVSKLLDDPEHVNNLLKSANLAKSYKMRALQQNK